jgi:hypothetical protein
VAKLVPMLGAVFAHAGPPKSEGRVRPKPKTTRHGHRVTRGEKSVSQPHQQHGELPSMAEPRPLTERMAMREHAKHEMRRATEEWVSGRITTHEHKAVHARGKHILAGKHPHEFSGKSGEKKIKGLR